MKDQSMNNINLNDTILGFTLKNRVFLTYRGWQAYKCSYADIIQAVNFTENLRPWLNSAVKKGLIYGCSLSHIDHVSECNLYTNWVCLVYGV